MDDVRRPPAGEGREGGTARGLRPAASHLVDIILNTDVAKNNNCDINFCSIFSVDCN